MLDRLVRRRNEAQAPRLDAPLILLIDDDEDEATLLSDMLARVPGAAYRLESVTTPEGGLERLGTGRYAAALLDVRLGASSGLDVLRAAMERGCRIPIVMLTGERDPAVDRAALELGAVDFLAKGRFDPADLERTLRYAISARRSEQRLAAIEETGRLVGEQGLSADVLEQVVALLSARLGFKHVSIYLAEGEDFRLGAQEGYAAAITTLEVTGSLSQVLRTRRATFVPNLTVDPDVRGGDEPGMELCLPLFLGPDVLGLLLVGSPAEAPIGESDHATLTSVADRLAAALVLAQDRLEVSARVQRFRRLSRFAAALNAATDPSTLDALVSKSAAEVVSADVVILAVHDRASDRFLVRSTHGPDLPPLGSELDAWAAAQRAMESGQIELGRYEDRWGAAVPLVRHGRVIGLLLMERVDRPFDPLEREAFPLIADQVALAVASRLLEQGEALAAVRDGATGLFTEAYATAALTESLASRRRVPRAERTPLSALFLSLDHDDSTEPAEPGAREVALSALAKILLTRLRASDLVWRSGQGIAAVLLDARRDQAATIAEQVAQLFAAASEDGAPISTISGGCAALDDEGDQPLAAAEAALMMAQRAGGDTVVRA
ncbi:MAG: GAF domain-containing protein [Chloroflexota bacterium]|nr:GAF domain-containing protein [Chloroflexota bacterium]